MKRQVILVRIDSQWQAFFAPILRKLGINVNVGFELNEIGFHFGTFRVFKQEVNKSGNNFVSHVQSGQLKDRLYICSTYVVIEATLERFVYMAKRKLAKQIGIEHFSFDYRSTAIWNKCGEQKLIRVYSIFLQAMNVNELLVGRYGKQGIVA